MQRIEDINPNPQQFPRVLAGAVVAGLNAGRSYALEQAGLRLSDPCDDCSHWFNVRP